VCVCARVYVCICVREGTRVCVWVWVCVHTGVCACRCVTLLQRPRPTTHPQSARRGLGRRQQRACERGHALSLRDGRAPRAHQRQAGQRLAAVAPHLRRAGRALGPGWVPAQSRCGGGASLGWMRVSGLRAADAHRGRRGTSGAQAACRCEEGCAWPALWVHRSLPAFCGSHGRYRG